MYAKVLKAALQGDEKAIQILGRLLDDLSRIEVARVIDTVPKVAAIEIAGSGPGLALIRLKPATHSTAVDANVLELYAKANTVNNPILVFKTPLGLRVVSTS